MSAELRWGEPVTHADLQGVPEDGHRRELVDGAYLSATPLLVVEVLSPSTRLTDLGTKRMLYERSGVLDYWTVDPQVPRLTALHLDDGGYKEVAVVDGGDVFPAATPFPVEIQPSDLVDTGV